MAGNTTTSPDVYVNSKCTSFAGMCDVELPKMLDVSETLVLALSLLIDESYYILEDIFSPRLLLVCPNSDSSFLSIFFLHFNIANDIVFLIFKLN